MIAQSSQHNTTKRNATTSQEQCQCQRSAAHISLQGSQSGVTSWPYMAQPCWTRCHPGQAKPRCERERPACRSALHEFPGRRDFGVGTVRTCWSWALRSDELAEPIRSDVANTLGSGWIDRGKRKSKFLRGCKGLLLCWHKESAGRNERPVSSDFISIRFVGSSSQTSACVCRSACLTMLRFITRT